MTVIIDGTLGITNVNGSAAAPANTGTDTDTGIVYGTNTLSLSTGGTTAVTVDSSQNVGIGTSSPGYRLDTRIASAGQIANFSDGTQNLIIGTTASLSYVNGQGGVLGLYTSGLERARIDSSGNVGMGVTSMSATTRLTLGRTSTSAISYGLMVQNIGAVGNTGQGAQISFGNDQGSSSASPSGYIQTINTGGATNASAMAFGGYNGSGFIEYARYDSSGNLLVGATATINLAKMLMQFTNASNGFYLDETSNSSGTQYVRFSQSGTQTGSITRVLQTSAVNYGTSSDYRLKENIAPMIGALQTVARLKPVTYTWKDCGVESDGFIAHELAEVFPQAVVGEKDAVNEDGSINPQAIDTSFLVATLTAAIQEQQAIITQLQADVAALKGQA
jgi:Chaperone of endosialidase